MRADDLLCSRNARPSEGPSLDARSRSSISPYPLGRWRASLEGAIEVSPLKPYMMVAIYSIRMFKKTVQRR